MFRSPFADGIIILVILLLFVGPKRLPMLSRSVGESIKEFKGGVTDHADDKKLDAAPPSEPTTHTEPTTHSTDKRDTVS